MVYNSLLNIYSGLLRFMIQFLMWFLDDPRVLKIFAWHFFPNHTKRRTSTEDAQLKVKAVKRRSGACGGWDLAQLALVAK